MNAVTKEINAPGTCPWPVEPRVETDDYERLLEIAEPVFTRAAGKIKRPDGPEAAACLVVMFDSQVCNGGLLQWCDNGYADTVGYLLSVLDEIPGTDWLARNLEEYVGKYENDFADYGELPSEDDYWLIAEDFDRFDTIYYKLRDDFLRSVVNYVTREAV